MTTLPEALDELVALARHFRHTPSDVTLDSLHRLERLHHILYYYAMSRPSWTQYVETRQSEDAFPFSVNTKCDFAECDVTWRTRDACLLNFARPGERPLWLCRTHHPPVEPGRVQPVAFTAPMEEPNVTDIPTN